MARLDERNMYDLIANIRNFEIPIYQRNYDWNEKDVIKFFEDICENFHRHKEKKYNLFEAKYYIGNIIVFDDIKKDRNTLMVVDGQQRITSTIIIFAAIRKILKKIYDSNKNIDSDLEYRYKNLMAQIEKITSQNGEDKTR